MSNLCDVGHPTGWWVARRLGGAVLLANDVQETPAKGRHLLDGSPFGYDAHKGETQRTHNPLVAGSIPAGAHSYFRRSCAIFGLPR